MTFKYELNTKVYFQEKKENFEGTIIKRSFEEEQHSEDYNFGSPAHISSEHIYSINASCGIRTFKEWQFGREVFLDKKRFIEEKVIIK